MKFPKTYENVRKLTENFSHVLLLKKSIKHLGKFWKCHEVYFRKFSKSSEDLRKLGNFPTLPTEMGNPSVGQIRIQSNALTIEMNPS